MQNLVSETQKIEFLPSLWF